jgi:hypothetical protein
MILEVLISVTGALSVGCIFAITNLLRKQERAEDLISMYEDTLTEVGKVLVSSTDYLKELDSKGHFRADDELGEFFIAMKEAQDNINKVFVEYYDKIQED